MSIPMFGQYPAITRNSFGKGTLTYEGTYLSDRLQENVVLDTLRTAGVPLTDAGLPAPVKAKHGILGTGRRSIFISISPPDRRNSPMPMGRGWSCSTEGRRTHPKC